MPINKIIPGDSQEELIKQAGQMHQVYESRRHIKSAASRIFSRGDLEAHAPPSGKFLSHMITMGSSEMYGGNRNHDLWPHEELKKSHDTFVTHARNYREHKNQRPEYAIGQIKAARYDERLQRGEVLMWTDIDKAASEFEKARKGEEQSGSMAASVESDICEGCGFVSKFARERCEHIRDTPGKWLHQFQKYARMINIGPLFKDYSFVGRPADRIAHHLNYLLPHEKLASAAPAFLRGDQLAEAYAEGDRAWEGPLSRIAAFDRRQEHPAKQAAATALFCRAFGGELPAAALEKMASHPYPGRVLRSLAKRAMVMPLASFNAFVSGVALAASQADPAVKEAAALLPQLRAQLLDGGGPAGFGAAVDQFEASASGCDDLIDTFLDQARDQFSLRYEALAKRAFFNEPALQAAPPTAPSSQAYGLAALYNAYLVKVAETLAPDDWIAAGQLAALR